MATLGGGRLPTLGGGAASLVGVGVSANVIRRGMTGVTSGWRWRTEIGGGKVTHVDRGVRIVRGEAICWGRGVSGVTTLGRPGIGSRVRPGDGGAKRRHDSNTSLRLESASSWDMVVGGGLSMSASVISWSPWTILSSAVGTGMVR